MRLLLLFSLFLTGCATRIQYVQTPSLAPISKTTGEIKTIIKTITTSNETAVKLIETKLAEQEQYILKSENEIAKLSVENESKKSQILDLVSNESKLTKKNIKLWLATVSITLLFLGSIALRFINIKII